MTFAEYDAFVAEAAHVEKFNHSPYWPNPADIEVLAQKFPAQKLVLFLEWLLSVNGEPANDQQRDSQHAMRQYNNQHLILADEEEAPNGGHSCGKA